MEFLNDFLEGKKLLNILHETYELYCKYGSRSSKKVDHFHNFIKNEIEKQIEKQNKKDNEYSVKLEQDVKCCNSTNKKKCDIVVFKNNIPYIIFPVKLIMTNYKQNKNNSWENLTGELSHLKWANPDILIVPINIFMNKTPYLKKDTTISKFENITYDDISQYNILNEKQLIYANINYIIDVDHNNKIGDKYKNAPTILNFNIHTCYKSFTKMINELI